MPETPTANMSLVKPTPGGDNGIWDDELNAVIDQTDAHDHSTGKGVKVTPAGMNINAALNMNGQRATALAATVFNAIASSTMTAVVRALWFNSADGELYIRTTGGADLKLTNGAALNISALGGIVGDYTTSTAQVAYDAANKRYTMRSATSPAKFADVHMASVKIHQVDPATSSFGVIISVGAMVANYTLTLPAALPGATALLQVSAAGVISYSNTIAQPIVMAADKDITVSGAGLFKHGARQRNVLGNTFHQIGAAAWGHAADGSYATSNSSAVMYQLPIDRFERLNGVVVAIFGDGAADITGAEIFQVLDDGSIASISATVTSTNPAAAWDAIAVPVTSPIPAGDGYAYFLKVTCSAAGIRIGNIKTNFDCP